MDKKIKVGVVGCGTISPAYFNGCKPYDWLEIAACADMDPAVAKARAEEFGVPRVCSVEDLLHHPEIQIVLNLTIPKAHAQVNQAALSAGKHAYCEKPLAVSREEGRKTLALAAEKGLRLGCAPDTFLGGGGQTCRQLIDEGAIGVPVAATAFLAGHGHESWHPNPEFYYKPGGGPLMDMGPYYLTALVNFLGPVRRVSGSCRASFPERVITSEPKKGSKITVETSTHIAGTLDFQSGAVASLLMSFDVWGHHMPLLEIHGSEGSLSVPDPNFFKGTVLLKKPGEKEWKEIPLTHNAEVTRGIGLADMALGILENRPHRVSGEMAFHVLDAMQAFEESSQAGKHVILESSCQRPAPLKPGLPLGALD